MIIRVRNMFIPSKAAKSTTTTSTTTTAWKILIFEILIIINVLWDICVDYSGVKNIYSLDVRWFRELL